MRQPLASADCQSPRAFVLSSFVLFQSKYSQVEEKPINQLSLYILVLIFPLVILISSFFVVKCIAKEENI
jgi:hypothetical protein